MYSSQLAGAIGENLSINTLFPSVVQLTEQFGGGKITVKGNFPSVPSAEIHLEILKEKYFALEFRLPANTSIADVSVNGKKKEAKQNNRGFFELKRRWKKGDVITIDLNYELKAHFQDGEEGKKWLAFTYGPLALAQKITEMPDEEPFIDLGSNALPQLLNRLSRSSDSEIKFTVEGTGITLIPYYQTGSKQSGPRTYFELKNKK